MTHAFSAEDLSGHADFLQRMARALVGDPELARDAAQDTLVAALEHAPPAAEGLRPWLATVLRNQTRNRYRREQRRAEREHAVARAESIEGGHDIVERIELQRLVCEAVLALDGPKRDAIFLRYYDGLTPSAIAERQGESVKTVKSRLNRALEELRERLDAKSHGDRRAWAAVLVPLVRAGHATPRATALGGSFPLLAAGAAVVLAFAVWRLASRATEPAPLPKPSVAAAPGPSNAVAPVTSSARTPIAPSEPLVASTGTLEVHLRWESDGAAAAGIGIDAWAENDPAPRQMRQRATSDALGIARFDALVPGPVELRLDRTAAFSGESVAGETRTLELVVPTGNDVVGRVVTEAGTPVAGAELWIEDLFERLPDPWPAGRSAADGSFRLRGLSGRQRIVARSADHVTTSSVKTYELQPDANDLRTAELVLSEGGEPVTGRVLAPDGSGVADAIVWIGSSSHNSPTTANGKLVESPGSAWARTDATGSFVSPSSFPEGLDELTVLAPGFAGWRGEFEVVAGTPATIEVRLPPAATITGTVHDGQGAPVAGARITAKSTAGDSISMRGGKTTYIESLLLPELRATTDASGAFELGWTSGKSYALEAQVPGRPELGLARASFEPAENVALDLQLDPDPRITGRVVDASGRGLAGWFVQAVPDPLPGEIRDVHTDSAGAFAFYGIEAGAYRIVAMASNKGLQPTVEKAVHAGDVGLELVLTGPSAFDAGARVQVSEADGRPVTDVRVLAQSLRGYSVLLPRDARTGRFEYVSMEPGRYRLKAMRNQRVLALSAEIELASGTTTDCGVLTIPVPGALTVRVTGVEEGIASPRLERPGFGIVALVERDGEKDGAYVATDLAPGSWWLRVSSFELFAPDREIEILSGESSEIEVALERATRFTVRIDRADAPDDVGTALVLEVHDAAGKLLVHSIQDRGTRLGGNERTLTLPRGPITLDAWTEDGRRGRATSNVGEELQQPFVIAVR
jgi:RNA polymerase sigma-70 factor (ECF subfamily)